MAESDWGLGDVRGGKPLPGTSPSGMSEALYGLVRNFFQSPEALSLLRRTFALVPQNAGDIKVSVAATIPVGWLLCDGSEYAISSYQKLYAAIGNIAGGTAGSTFRVPDLRGRFPRGRFGSDTLSSYGGEDTHVLTPTEMPAHAHTITDPGHAHQPFDGRYFPTTAGTAIGMTAGAAMYQSINYVGVTTTNATGITVNNTGGDGAHNNIPAYSVVNFLIFTGA